MRDRLCRLRAGNKLWVFYVGGRRRCLRIETLPPRTPSTMEGIEGGAWSMEDGREQFVGFSVFELVAAAILGGSGGAPPPSGGGGGCHNHSSGHRLPEKRSN
ncbi:hypothetical protein LIER_19124 [Lithospermum erythrorhizon]|uniref:Uncharacterized protein n=1 Tax=Lithospermum erythrorhizon TaxID=34254 RepID=A0AAV3QJI7_LITER